MPFQKMFRQSVSSFIRLETADNETTLVAADGSLVSYIKVEGSRQIIGEEEYNHIIESATIKIGSRFDRQGHAMQIYFVRDPGRIGERLQSLIRPSRVSAQSIGLEIDDLIQERVNHLERFLTHEELYFVLWTRPTILTKNEFERSKKDARENAKKWLPAGFSQYPYAALEPLRARHKSFVAAASAALNEMGIRGQLMEVHDALRSIRNNL
ncbi:MAG: type IV secretion protein IcmB, partial [Alphaproteobacteria bacterium]